MTNYGRTVQETSPYFGNEVRAGSGFSIKAPPLICLSSNFSNVPSMNDVRLMDRSDFVCDDFLGLDIYTTLICLQLIGMYPKAKLAISSISSFPPSS
jgi:hypothetical protein